MNNGFIWFVLIFMFRQNCQLKSHKCLYSRSESSYWCSKNMTFIWGNNQKSKFQYLSSPVSVACMLICIKDNQQAARYSHFPEFPVWRSASWGVFTRTWSRPSSSSCFAEIMMTSVRSVPFVGWGGLTRVQDSFEGVQI